MENSKDWLEEWLQLWPKQVTSGGLTVQSPAKYCINKMQKFCKTYPQYTKQIIFAATSMYIKEREQEGYKFTKRATYFIDKQDQGSLLEAYCEKLLAPQPIIKQQITEYNAIDDFI